MFLYAPLGLLAWDGGVRRAVGTDHAAGSLHCFGLTVQLVPEAFDVVQAIGNDYVIARQHPLHGRIFFRARILLGPGSVIDGARDPKALIVDEVDFKATGAGIGGSTGNLGLEVLLQLQGPGSLASRGVACGLVWGEWVKVKKKVGDGLRLPDMRMSCTHTQDH